MIANNNFPENPPHKESNSVGEEFSDSYSDGLPQIPLESITESNIFYDIDYHEYYAGLAKDLESHHQLIEQSHYDEGQSIVCPKEPIANQDLVQAPVEESTGVADNSKKANQNAIEDNKLINIRQHEVVETPGLTDVNDIKNESSELVLTTSSNRRIYSPKLVVQQNKLLESFKDLDIYERRLLLYLSTTIRAEVNKNPNQNTFLVHILDFARVFGLEKGKYLNSFIRESGKAMQTKVFSYQHEENGFVDDVDVNFAFRFRYRPLTDQMWVTLASEVVHMLTVFDTDHPFTYYDFADVVNMKNQNTINLFESLMRYRVVKKRTMTVEHLRKLFKCEEKYGLITDFMRYAVQRAVNDINDLTNLKVKTVVEKKGGTPFAVMFKFSDTKQDMYKKGKELALIDFDYKTEAEISKHNENKALKLTRSQLHRVVTRKKFVEDHQVASNSPENASMMTYYNHMIDRLIKDASFVVKHTLDYYLEQEEDAS